MATYNPDFTAAKELDPGSYNAKVAACEEKTSKAGNNYLQWTLEVTDPGYAGSKVWTNTVMSGKGAGMLKHFLKSIDGLYDGGPFDSDNYLGRPIGVTVEPREFNGKTSMNVKEVYPIQGGVDATEEDIPF